jgi:hypothetical protein
MHSSNHIIVSAEVEEQEVANATSTPKMTGKATAQVSTRQNMHNLKGAERPGLAKT